MALVIAAVTRQPLQQELSLAIHLVAFYITVILIGALIGWLVSRRKA